MSKTLSEFAKEQNKSYQTIYSQYKRGQLQGYKSDNGEIVIGNRPSPAQNNVVSLTQFVNNQEITPLSSNMEETRGSTSVRRNSATTIERSDRFINIDSIKLPYKYSGIGGTNYISMTDVVILSRKAYFGFSIVRNVIEIMVEFSCAKVFLTGGSEKSKKFFIALFNKINLDSLQDQCFRELYRSGNLYIYKMQGTVNPAEMIKISQVFGAKDDTLPKYGVKLPIRYIVLDSAQIAITSGAWFSTNSLYKQLNDYEIAALKNPKTPEDKEIYDSLPEETKKLIKNKSISILLPLNPDLVTTMFYKKQDYEAFSIPFTYSILDDLEYKSELKKADAAIIRTLQNVILLVTHGNEPDKGGVNQKVLDALNTLFQNQSIGRVLVSDFSTKAEWVIPKIADILNEAKYAVVDRDIREGLNAILFNSQDGEKFSNTSIKIQIFIERLKQIREQFLNEFLIPEIKRISLIMGFKNYPTPHFEDLNLKDETVWGRLYAQLVQLGVITPNEAVTAFETGRLPTPEESLESQQKFREYKDKGLYQPITAAPFDQLKLAKETGKQQMSLQESQQEHDTKQGDKQRKHDAANPAPAPPPAIHINAPNIKLKGPNGRPSGSKSPQSTKKISPVGTSRGNENEEAYSLTKIKDNMILADKLDKELEKTLLKDFKLKELNAKQTETKDDLINLIITNEEPKNWGDKNIIKGYLNNLKNNIDNKIVEERNEEKWEISYNHGINEFLAGVLLNSKTEIINES